ncbi:MAG: OmpA family protein [Gammaproteobacteria bacterium]|nr:OmpA family protein [Gammaproteobacteria bacterium]
MRQRIAALVVVTLLTLPASLQAGLTSMRGPLFESTDDARARAEVLDAPLLAPASYGEAVGYYDRADSTFKRAGSIDSIRRSLSKAEARFNKSAEAAKIAAVAFDAAIQARKDAFASEAPQYSADSWYSGESNFSEATRRLERGSIKFAQRYASKAESDYRESELSSIKANYLSETKELLRLAEKLRAERYAPMSLNNARLLLETAESELNVNRYDTDRPRLLALDAKHNALHAIYVSKLARRVRDRATNLEAVLLEWEGSISRIGDVLNKPLYFDDGEKAAIEAVLAGIRELQRNKDRIDQDLNDREAQVAALNNQIAKTQAMMAELTALQEEKQLMDQDLDDRDVQVSLLNARLAKMQELLGGGNQTIDELETLLERQARHRERFARVENLFQPQQAAVFRQHDTVIIRMIGLNFDSGAAQLKTEHFAMLQILEQAISEFPESQVIVEGHTDAFGSDAQNLELSRSRAKSVVQHLLASMPISPINLRSVGYGESRPVANNETAEGRKRNRRIDVVIQPSWVTQGSVASVQIDDMALDANP